MIKLSHATWGAIIPMLFLTWYFSGLMDEYHTEQMRLQEAETARGLEWSKTGTLLGMAQQRTAAAAGQVAAAKQAKFDAISGGIMGAAK